MTEEKVFKQEGGITVTSTRFSVRRKTYGMANITSVSAERKTRSQIGPLILIGIGMFVVIRLYFNRFVNFVLCITIAIKAITREMMARVLHNSLNHTMITSHNL